MFWPPYRVNLPWTPSNVTPLVKTRLPRDLEMVYATEWRRGTSRGEPPVHFRSCVLRLCYQLRRSFYIGIEERIVPYSNSCRLVCKYSARRCAQPTEIDDPSVFAEKTRIMDPGTVVRIHRGEGHVCVAHPLRGTLATEAEPNEARLIESEYSKIGRAHV